VVPVLDVVEVVPVVEVVEVVPVVDVVEFVVFVVPVMPVVEVVDVVPVDEVVEFVDVVVLVFICAPPSLAVAFPAIARIVMEATVAIPKKIFFIYYRILKVKHCRAYCRLHADKDKYEAMHRCTPFHLNPGECICATFLV
jgi:hypothetical protein